jgi:hypothetical protein
MAKRQNPDGTPATAQRTLGFAGTIDITNVLTSGKAKLAVKAGTSAVQVKEIDFSASTPDALTPAEAVIALTAAGFIGVTFSVDAKTGRLMAAASDSSEIWLQVYSDLAGALNFGGCRYTEGKGCYLYPSFDDDVKSAIPTVNWSEDTVIENDGAYGRKTKYTIPGKRDTVTLAIIDKVASNEFKQMVDGGKWIKVSGQPEVYEPPTGNDQGERRLDIYCYTYLFVDDSNVKGGQRFIEEDLYVGAVGHASKVIAAGAWTDSQYDFTVGEYTDTNDEHHACPKETKYTRAQWEELNIANGVIVRDWESLINA